MNEEIKELKESIGIKERIFPRKGEGRECYDTRMLYEINEYLENASNNTFDKVYKYMNEKLNIATEALDFYAKHHHHMNTTAPNFAREALDKLKKELNP